MCASSTIASARTPASTASRPTSDAAYPTIWNPSRSRVERIEARFDPAPSPITTRIDRPVFSNPPRYPKGGVSRWATMSTPGAPADEPRARTPPRRIIGAGVGSSPRTNGGFGASRG